MNIDFGDAAAVSGIIAVIGAVVGGVVKMIRTWKGGAKQPKSNPHLDQHTQLENELILIRQRIENLNEDDKEDKKAREDVIRLMERLDSLSGKIKYFEKHLNNDVKKDIDRLRNDIGELFTRISKAETELAKLN